MKKIVLDIETQKSFDEVGGAHNKAKLGVSVVGTYHYDNDKFVTYREEDLDRLEHDLKEAELLIGFNLIGFDWPVLAANMGDWIYDLPTLDIMFEAQKALGHRVSLNSMAMATLDSSKLGSGLDALEYYRNGDWDKLERYCLEDVKITRDIYEYALKEGHAYFMKGKRRAVVPMSFSKNPYFDIFQNAAKTKASVKMVYGAKERLVDVKRFDGIYIRAFCNLRKELLTFRLDRVESAEEVASNIPLFDDL